MGSNMYCSNICLVHSERVGVIDFLGGERSTTVGQRDPDHSSTSGMSWLISSGMVS